MLKSKKTYKKQSVRPVQERSKKTVEFIIQASIRILEQDGIMAFTTNRIAEVSGVGVGSIYQYFNNKEHIIEAIVEQHIEDIRAVIQQEEARFTPANPMDAFSGLIEGVVAAHLTQPNLHRAITDIPSFSSQYPSANKKKEKLDLEIHTLLKTKLRLLTGIEDEARLNIATLIIHTLGESTIHHAIIDQSGKFDIAILKKSLKKIISLYLKELAGAN